MKSSRIAALVAASCLLSAPAFADTAVETVDTQVSVSAETDAVQTRAPIKRSEVIKRAEFWVDQEIPYSMDKFAADPEGKKYRTDCSGMVAMALRLGTSPNTESMGGYVIEIDAEKLLPGDIVGTLGPGTGGANGHVVIFESWANKAHTQINTLEQRGSKGASRNVRPLAFTVGSKTAKPYRFKNIVNG